MAWSAYYGAFDGPDLMPGYSAHQFCGRTATPRTRAEEERQKAAVLRVCSAAPASHHARLDYWFVFCASASTLGCSTRPFLHFLGKTAPTTHHPRPFHLSRASINQSLSQPTQLVCRFQFSSLVLRTLAPTFHHHDGQIFFSTVLVDSDCCAFHRRVRYSRSHCNQGMRSSKQDVVKRVPSI
jgi:hypothetical protein